MIHAYDGVGSWILRTCDDSSSIASLELVVRLERWWLSFRRICCCNWKLFWIWSLLWLTLLLSNQQLMVLDELLAHLALFELLHSHLHWVLVLNTPRRPLHAEWIRIRVTCVAISGVRLLKRGERIVVRRGLDWNLLVAYITAVLMRGRKCLLMSKPRISCGHTSFGPSLWILTRTTTCAWCSHIKLILLHYFILIFLELVLLISISLIRICATCLSSYLIELT